MKFFNFFILSLATFTLADGADVAAPPPAVQMISIPPSPHAKAAAPKTASKTTITSQTLEMVSGLTENTFYFSKDVHVKGTNLDMTADQMVVTAARAEGSPNDVSKVMPSGQNQMGTIHKIVGIGNVHILQEGRESISGRAEFSPKDNKVVLTENPRVIDSQAIVSGWRITLFQGERKVMVEQDPSGSFHRPTVDLGALPDMGFDPKKQPPPSDLPPANAAAAATVPVQTPAAK